MSNKEAQAIYNDGYNKGQEDSDARFRIGRVYAYKSQLRDLRAIQALYRNDKRYSEDYRNGYIDAMDRYIGVLEFSHDVDMLAIKNTVEEQMRIARNRLEKRYGEALDKKQIDRNSYLQIIACIEATYQELFMAGFNVGIGELIGPQKITVKED